MKNQKLLTVAALAGLSLGGLSITAASADTDGAEQSTTLGESTETVVEADTSGPGIILVQDTDAPGDQTEDEASDSGRRRRGGCNLEAAASVIGIDEAELRAAIDSGDTIADVAAANGVAVDAVIDAMIDAKADRITDKVTEGRITQDEADEKLAELEGRISDQVNGLEEAEEA